MITQQQKSDRRKYIGSSDMAAILGLDPYRSAWDVWAEKTGRVESFAGNKNTRRGNYLEPGLMMFAEDELGHPIERDISIIDPQGSRLAVNLDGRCAALNANVEGKSISGEVDPDEWGDPGTDLIPERTIIQTHAAMAVAGLSVSFVPVALPVFKQFEFRMYRVDFNPELGDTIRRAADAFWRDHVLADVPPTDSVPSIEVLKRMRRTPNKTASLTDAIVDRWIALRAARLQAEKDEKAAEQAVLAELGDAEAGSYSAGSITYFETTRKGYEVKECSYRTLRIVGAKKAKRIVSANIPVMAC